MPEIGLKGPIHHALDTREIEAGEGAIAIAIEDYLNPTPGTWKKEEYIEVTLNLCLSLFSLSLILCASFLYSHI